MRGKKVFIKKLWTNLIIFAAFMLVLIGSAAMLGNILWRNANEMGLSLVRNYSSAEEQTIKTCETILEICTNYIAEREYQVYQNAMNSTVRACRAIYYIDVDKMTVDTVYPLGADGRPRHSTYASEVTDRFKYDVVAEEHKDLVADFLDMGNIIKRLEKRDHIELQFKRSMFDVNKREITGRGYEWCSISVTEAERKNGRLTAIAMAIRSIDDVMRREEEQQQMLALAVSRAEAASRAKSDFLSRMSHDIRTPMNAILGMTSIAAMHIDEKSRVLDGDSALARIAQTGFSAIILDWKMPGKDGLKTAKEIRRTGAHIPIIVLSAYDWTDIETEAQEAGVDAFISKPMFKSKLIHVLQSVLGGNDEEEGVNALETFQQQDYSGIRVLLVEDNDINVEVAQELLGIVGIQAETARAIRSSGREDLRSIPIIAMTADAFSDDIQKSRDAGMNDHISKPVDLGRLEEVLRKWITQTGPKAQSSIDKKGAEKYG